MHGVVPLLLATRSWQPTGPLREAQGAQAKTEEVQADAKAKKPIQTRGGIGLMSIKCHSGQTRMALNRLKVLVLLELSSIDTRGFTCDEFG